MANNLSPASFDITSQTIYDYIFNHRKWSLKTFGNGDHLEGLLKHISKEVEEVREADSNEEKLEELIDIIILSIDAAWRLGFFPYEITSVLIEKHNRNKTRTYPKITDPNEPTEHIRE
jgi:predicted house-cleaning noncanonical NTP pyrophosphatase (MazG superfamily)